MWPSRRAASRSRSFCVVRRSALLRPKARRLALAVRLAVLDQLCPGDFAAVKRQIDILGEALEPAEFLAQLEAEHRIKPEVREARKIGF